MADKKRDVALGTYLKVEEFFKQNSEISHYQTHLRDILMVDYISLKIIIAELEKRKIIVKDGRKFRYNGN